jgi:hypothetical protein
MVKSKYVQFVLDHLCREPRIVKRETLLDEFEKTFTFKSREIADAALNQVLRRLLRQGLIVKRARGFYYCNPESPTPTAVGVSGVEEAVADLDTVHDLYKKKVG